MKIYKTTNIEDSIRHMAQSNKHSAVFEFSWCLRAIRTNMKKIADIPSILVRPWDAIAPERIAKWEREGGLMYYRHYPRMDLLPQSEALLFNEMPLSIKDLEKFQDRASKEIIIYQPPDWSMHEEMMNFKYPNSEVYKRLRAFSESITGRSTHNVNQSAALACTDWRHENVAIFYDKELCDETKTIHGQYKGFLVQSFSMAGHYLRYHPFKPMVEPSEPDLLEMYRVLESQTDMGGGLRMLKFGEIYPHVTYFQKAIKAMVAKKYVAKYEPVHLILKGWKEPDYEVMDAIASVRRENCLKLRRMVEQAPEYLSV